MINKENLKKVLDFLEFTHRKEIYTYKNAILGYTIVVDFAGNPIPYAALYLKELKTGFTTDDNGCFQTSLQPGQYTCEVSSLGFAGQTFSFSISTGDLEKNIVLSEQVYSLREVNVVKGAEDPACSVMRKAIANAPYYRKSRRSFWVSCL